MGKILRWSGSKAKLVPHLVRLIPSHFGTYIEPFAGSASLFFALRPKQAVLGDKNIAVIDVYRATKGNLGELRAWLDSIPRTAEGYYALRALDEHRLTLEQRAARLIFLMKACFNGVYRTNRAGRFNVPLGSRIYALPTSDDLIEASNALRGARLVAKDFEKTLAFAKRGDLVYLDPPYADPGRYRGEFGYSAHFLEADFKRLIGLARELAQSGVNMILSYADERRIVMELSDWNVVRHPTYRTVAGSAPSRKHVQELILTSY